MSTPAVIPWIQYGERVVGENSPDYPDDVANRAVKFLITQSDFGSADLFPGFLVRHLVVATPEASLTANPGIAAVDTANARLYIKMTGVGNIGWVAIGGNLSGNGTPEAVVTADIGKLYEQRDAALTSGSVWVKRSGVGNTGWRQLVGAYAGVGTTSIETGIGAIANATDSIAIGRAAIVSASSDSAIVIGPGATTTGSTADSSIVIGKLATSNADSAVVIGNGATTTSVDSVTIGHLAITSLGLNIAIGLSANSAGASGSSKNIAIGANSTTGGFAACTAVGGLATASQTSTSAFGSGATASGINSTAIGASTTTGGFSHSIALGTSSACFAANQLVIGSTISIINTMTIGAGDTVNAAQNLTFRLSNATNADTAAGTLTVIAGRATGNAASGNIIFQTGQVAASSAVVQTATTRFTISNFSAFVSNATPAAAANGACVDITGNIIEAGSGVHARLVGLSITAPTITAGAATVTDAATVYISDAPAAVGANNWALWVDSGTTKLDGKLFVGATSNANNTAGITINQGASDDEVISFKSSDVAHGITTLAETDTYGRIKKADATLGGIDIAGFGSGTEAGIIFSAIHTTANTTKSIAGRGAQRIVGFLKSGTTVGSLGANANIISFEDAGTTRFILDADGDSHQDVGTAWTNFDITDDIALLNKLSAHVTRHDDPLRESFGEWLTQSREELERLRLVTFNDDNHHFVNMSRLTMLHTGAIRQLGAKFDKIERMLNNLLSGGENGTHTLRTV